ncbi:MAG TPA: hypothetical protein VE631_09815, partial [Alphaproteobacteria bacterium]|nr:hypothetical protein [Alphaproteobacteria bacterium]
MSPIAIEPDYGFQEFRSFRFFDFLELELPARWRITEDEPNRWYCGEEEAESGDFHIQFEFMAVIGDPSQAMHRRAVEG